MGVIPEGWEEVSVENIKAASENALSTGPFGSSISSQFFLEQGVPVIRGNNLSNSIEIKLKDDGLVFVSPEKAIEFRRSIVRKGDLIFTCWGTINQIGLIDDQSKYLEYVISNKQMKLTPNPDKANSLFLYYLFSGHQIQSIIKNKNIGTSVPGFNLGQLRELRFKVPPLPEQRSIATALSDMDELLGGLDRLIAKKRDLKQSAMQQLLTGKTRLPGFDSEWEVKRLGDLTEMGSGGTPLSSITAYYDGDIPWVSISDMTKGGKVLYSTDRNLTHAGFFNSAAQMFPSGTVLYAMYASLGECSIAGVSLCSSQAILGIRPNKDLNGEFLYYFLTSLKTTVKSLGQQGTQSNLNKGMVQDFILSLPPLPEQTAIASILSDMDTEIAAIEQRRNKTRDLKQAMMQELLTGRIRLKIEA
jgi:type I restriction enzyme S subunit